MNDELPQGWAECKMGDVAMIVGGGTPDSQDQECFSVEGGIPWLTPADLSDNKAIYVRRGKRFLTKKGLDRSSARLVPKGTVLFSSRAPIGYVAIAANQMSTNQGFKSFVVADNVCPEFIYFWLRFATPLAEELASGTTFAEISGSNAAKIPLRLPPLAEQVRIVSKLEGLLSTVLVCQKRLERIPMILKRFRHAVLAAACSGRLTADWRDDHVAVEPSSIYLAKAEEFRKANVASANRASKSTKFRYKPAAVIDVGNKTKGVVELFELPATWTWASLGQLTWCVADGPHFSPKYVQRDEGVPFISGRNISYEGIDFSDAKYVSHDDHKEFSKRTRPLPGDILLTKGGTTGVATVVRQAGEFSVWVHVAVLKVVPELVTPFYLRDVLSSPFVYNQSQAQTHGVGNQDLGLTRMVHMALPLPPIAEQREIVRRVEAFFAHANMIEARFGKAKKAVDNLMFSVLAKAFRGELVPTEAELAEADGRDFESADKLLARIQARSAASGHPRRKSGSTIVGAR